MGNPVPKIPSDLLPDLGTNPRGVRFQPVPWDTLGQMERSTLPPMVRPPARAYRGVLGLGAFLLIAGWVFGAKAVAAGGVGLLATAVLAYISARRSSGAWAIKNQQVPERIVERQPVTFSFVFQNRQSAWLPSVTVRLAFEGCQAGEYFAVENSIGPREAREFRFKLIADRGMGRFELGPIQVVVRDALGLFVLCIEDTWLTEVEVLPEVIPLESFSTITQGMSTHSGVFQRKTSGDSPNFLTLRQWRTGDSIRKIDWKRSQRWGELLVKDFESQSSTDVTLIVDQGSQGHCEFKGISSLEAMKDSAVSLIRFLLAQQLRVQLVSAGSQVGLGGGVLHGDLLNEAIGALFLSPDADFDRLLRQTVSVVPPDSVACLFFSSQSIAFDRLLWSLMALEERRVETFLIVLDSEAFATEVTRAARLDAYSPRNLRFLYGLGTPEGGHTDLARLIERLSERTFLIGPGETLADLCNSQEVAR